LKISGTPKRGRPHLVRPIDHLPAQQVGEHLVTGRRLGRPRLGTQCLDAHLSHQSLHPLAIDRQTLLAQHQRQPPRAQEGELRKQLVDPAHQAEIVVIGRTALAVDARARQSQQTALPADRQIGMLTVEQGSAVRNAHLPDLRAKKSRSTTSSPIRAG
jgi:hypothetical protein